MSNEFIIPNKILTGKNSLEDSVEDLKLFGEKVLIVTDNIMVKLGNVQAVIDILDKEKINYFIYDEINGEPTDVMIDKGVNLYKKENCNYLLAVGGGSSIDSAKAIAMMVNNKGKISDYMGKQIENKLPPIVAIPTTAGTGSEATKFTIISDTKTDVKMLIKGSSLMPILAIIDSRFTMTAPPKITAATGLDALTHAIEAYTSKKSQPLSDTFALSAIKKIFKYLPIAFNDGKNEEARTQMAIAALEAGIAFNNSSVTIVHGMSRPIGALFHVPHGISNAMLLKECFNFVLDGAYIKFADLARAIRISNEDEENEIAARKFVEEVDKLCKILFIPTLKEYGIDKEKFFNNLDKMAKDALESGSPQNTLKTVKHDDIVKVYKSLWR
ncbi:iron-containing alcohol dehydrogenase [Clostridium botulinum]|uniref:iron-containing alcohol dehydrogenase n=1 Tax=unclassified Clostridium TaxID=2614128 RepID=UPI000502B4F8|nr:MULTISPECIES: iron-containing alcohol dehydrogenase [unclassified Clostridium]AIY81103.1 iron-containing alcohol dehydrogenase family protein [Clostridium botulinum 202F]KAI3348651.1 iron-containing alcohol dehydrogenase [Clostridium botulinum]KFX58373.1 alcohol dehydrogenase [Clostridium botulinum]KON12532.1 alcohol dehydrogenase [Clostridium botulinum]MBY6778599.1 iron-containing alcohol dehydrogenase [Clostridium botulinum]